MRKAVSWKVRARSSFEAAKEPIAAYAELGMFPKVRKDSMRTEPL